MFLFFTIIQAFAVNDITLLQQWSQKKPSNAELWSEGYQLSIDYWDKMNYPKSLHPEIPEIKQKLQTEFEKSVNSESSMQNYIEIFAGAWIEKTYADITSYPLPKFKPAESDFAISKVQNSSFYAIVPDKVRIEKEVSTSMLKNGRIDAGEMVVIRVPLQNIYNRPLFSTSAFVSSSSAYSWSIANKEIELQELKPNQIGYLDVPLYISRSTPNQTTIPITIKLYDSKYFPTSPIYLQFSINISNLGHPTLYKTILERDMPGFSEESKTSHILADQRVEVRTDLLIQDNRVSGVLLDYQYDPLLNGTYVATEMTQRGTSGSSIVFESNDDLDFAINGNQDYQALRDKLIQKYPWQKQPTSYIAVDSLYYYETKKQKTEIQEVIEFTPIQYDIIKKISQQSLELKSLRPSSGIPSTALDATIGYYVEFDDTTFQELYATAITKSQKITTKEIVVEEVEKAPLYRSRHYIEVPLQAEERAISYDCFIMTKKVIDYGAKVSFQLNSQNLPTNARADIFVDGTKLYTKNPKDTIFIDQSLSVGNHKITVIVHDDSEKTLCSASSFVQVQNMQIQKQEENIWQETKTPAFSKIVRVGGGFSIISFNGYGFGTFQLNGIKPVSPLVQIQIGSEMGILVGLNGRIQLTDSISSFNLYSGFMLSNVNGPVKMALGIRPELAVISKENKVVWLDAGTSFSSYGSGFSLKAGVGWLF